MTRPMTPEEERFEDELSYVANMSEEEVARERIAMTAKVAKLQALVDAATRFEFGDWEARDRGDGVWIVRCEVSPPRTASTSRMTRDEAIAIARDLAAKEKEPTR